MKKVLVILLASLLLFSFTSCSNDNSSKVEEQKKEYEEKLQTEKDKQEAMIKAFEDFMAAYKTDIDYLHSLWEGYHNGSILDLTQGPVDETLSESKKPSFYAGDFKDFINLEEGQSFGHSVYALSDLSGTVTGTASNNRNLSLTFSENKFTIEYDVLDSNYNTVSSGNKLDVTLSGTYKEETTSDNKHVVDYNITINDKKYQLAYTYDNTTNKVLSASVNGTDVEIRLFNADGLSLVK